MDENNQDIITCQNCRKIVAIVDGRCSNCGEEVCLVCGCTDSEPCADVCWWVVPNICSTCCDQLEAEPIGEI